MCIPTHLLLKNHESPSAYHVFGSGMGVLLALRLFYLKSGRLDPNLLFEVEMLGLPCACIVSAMCVCVNILITRLLVYDLT